MTLEVAVSILALAVFGLLGVLRCIWIWQDNRRKRDEWGRYMRQNYDRNGPKS